MLLRRHRPTPEVDPAFSLQPGDTLDARFTKVGGVQGGDGAAAGDLEKLKGAELKAALAAAGLATTGTADEKRARLAAHLAQGKADGEQTGTDGTPADGEQTGTDDASEPQGEAETPADQTPSEPQGDENDLL